MTMNQDDDHAGQEGCDDHDDDHGAHDGSDDHDDFGDHAPALTASQ